MYSTPNNLQEFSYTKIEDLGNKRVIVRSCLNVAVDKHGSVIEDTRLKESMPLIKELSQKAKRVVVMGHLGRPEAGNFDRAQSFWHVAELMAEELRSLNKQVKLVQNFEDIKDDSNTIYLIDNIRFFKGEESKDSAERIAFAKQLASLADAFINDAFADYRESASTYDIATILPSYLGPVFLKEVEALSKLAQPQRPFVAIIGGAKLSEKLDALKALAENADIVLIGGAMAYTLLKAKGINTGNSLYEHDKLDVAKEILENFRERLVLPTDHLVTLSFDEVSAQDARVVSDVNVPDGEIAIDIGSKTVQNFKDHLINAKCILWNGPMGVFEWKVSEKGTLEVGTAISENPNAYKLAGGGDSIAAINKLGLTGFNHISTGGGAMLAFIAYNKFPTLDVIVN